MTRTAVAAMFLTIFLVSPVWASPPEGRALTFHDCELLDHYGKIVLVAYCPSAVPPTEIASLVLATKDVWIAKYGFVQYRIYSTRDRVPRSFAENMQKSDAWFVKYEIGTALFNSATGAKKFWCKKSPKDKLTDCTNLLK